MSKHKALGAPPARLDGRLKRTIVVAAVVLATSCSTHDTDTNSIQNSTPANKSPGALVSPPVKFQGYPALESVTQAEWTIRYRSTSGIDSSPTQVSGVMFVPKGDPPPDGWPVVSIGHSTTGFGSRCAPSTRIGLLGNLPSVIPFLVEGYVVVMTDYQGLGTPGPHPYLEPKTSGYNVIDAVRAAREVEPRTSNSWIAYGVSQGGQAVWSANELSGTYGDGLQLVGSISISPATDLTSFVDSMVDGTLTPAQITVLPALLEGVRIAHPELDVDDYMHGQLAERSDTFMTCIGEKAALQAEIAESITPADYQPIDTEAADRLREWLRSHSVPNGPAQQPMLVAYGDQDSLILPAWTESSVRDACALGDVIDLIVAPGQGHGILNIGSAAADWVDGRFDGTPAPDTCQR